MEICRHMYVTSFIANFRRLVESRFQSERRHVELCIESNRNSSSFDQSILGKCSSSDYQAPVIYRMKSDRANIVSPGNVSKLLYFSFHLSSAKFISIGFWSFLTFFLLFSLAAQATLAETSTSANVRLINNSVDTDRTIREEIGFGSRTDVAHAFTTGNHAAGYRVSSVDFDFSLEPGARPTFTMEIWSDSNGEPSSKLYTLSNPELLVDGINSFIAPDTGFLLTASTTYHIVWDVSVHTTRRGAVSVARIKAFKPIYLETNNSDDGYVEHYEGRSAFPGWNTDEYVLVRSYNTEGPWISVQIYLDMVIYGQPVRSSY